MKSIPALGTTLALALVALSACAAGNSAPDGTADADSSTSCSQATQGWAIGQSAKGATIANAEQLAEAPSWLPKAPACATVSVVSTYWIYPNATKEDLDAVVSALREQGAEVPDLELNPDRISVVADDYALSLTSKGVDGAPVQVMIVNADETPATVD